MNKYLITGITTPEFASAVLTKPQIRYDLVKPFFDQVGLEIIDFLIHQIPFQICTWSARAMVTLR